MHCVWRLGLRWFGTMPMGNVSELASIFGVLLCVGQSIQKEKCHMTEIIAIKKSQIMTCMALYGICGVYNFFPSF